MAILAPLALWRFVMLPLYPSAKPYSMKVFVMKKLCRRLAALGAATTAHDLDLRSAVAQV